ncbi:MAG: TRAP transporter small permease [Clostridia bacterium]|nr:TRAP transporter small permease [Clostridia bacterium]
MKKDYLGKILSFMTVVMFIGVVMSVMTQVITRYLPVSYPWTEELSRMFFVAAVCFCAPIAYRDYEFVIVDILVDQVPKRFRKYLNLIINIGIIILFAVVSKHGWMLAVNGHRQMSPTLGIPMSYAYALIPFAAICLIYYSVLNIKKIICEDILKNVKEGK